MSRCKAECHQRLLDHQEQQHHESPGDNLRQAAPTLSTSPCSSTSSTVSTTPRVPTPKPLPRQKSLPQQQFVEEIDYNEIETEEVVGKGSFGVVWRGRWRGRDVAIKHINTEGERRAFAVEVRQLSRVSHPNIVRLYGACTKNPVCLVMEYAEGGSLYNVLHGEPKTHYTAGHAISWALQCAQGVAYLHNMKPKPLIHRDLKPPNLLLINSGRTLKICDFGTACDLNTYMTNNKGSAAWMAPEVFEGSRYTEKCDVFSWGVILWEVLTRRKPFDDIGGSAYRIMWAVHTGQRPPLIEGCPQPIESLITKCWHKVPDERPSMDEIVQVMTILSEFFTGQDDPIVYRSSPSPILDDEELNDEDDDTIDVTWNTNSSQLNGDPETNCTHAGDNTVEVNQAGEKKNVQQTPQPAVRTSTSKSTGQNSTFQPLHIECDQNAWELTASTDSSWELQNMAGLDKMGRKTKKPIDKRSETSSDHLDNVYHLLDPELRPLTPDNTCELSRDIFEEHKQLAQEYLKVQTEIALVSQCKSNMLKNLSADGIRQQQELRKLEDEKESLVKLYRNLKRQLEIMKGQRRPTSIFNNPSTSMNSGDDGWVCVPRHEPSRIS